MMFKFNGLRNFYWIDCITVLSASTSAGARSCRVFVSYLNDSIMKGRKSY